MRVQEIKFKNLSDSYSILIGNNIINLLQKINKLCPKTKKIAIIFDKNVSAKNRRTTLNKLKNMNYLFLILMLMRKKSLKQVSKLLDKLFQRNFNRTDLVIAIGGGITGDTVGFVSSIFKRGINFINIPTTLLSQVDATVGGKTGVNSNFGKI